MKLEPEPKLPGLFAAFWLLVCAALTVACLLALSRAFQF
jgi:hypothetical protein